MKYEKLIIEEKEYQILEKILNLNNNEKSTTAKSHILKLQNELRNAIVMPLKEMPVDVVRLNSVVTISTKDHSWEKTFKLVLPSDSNIQQNKISLLLPMGTAVLGYAKGDTIIWDLPGGVKELKVIDIIQE